MAGLPLELTPSPGARGFATHHRDALGASVSAAWSELAFYAETCDLDLTSRSKGRRGLDVLLPVGRWEDSRTVDAILEDARAGRIHRIDQDRYEESLRSAHSTASAREIVTSLRRAGDDAGNWLGSPDDEAHGLRPTASPLGALPIRTLMHATVYHLAVIALDLEPCSPDPAPADLLTRGLVALVDVAGCLAARAGLSASLVADAHDPHVGDNEAGVWGFGSQGGDWATVALDASVGPTVAASARVILDITSGRISHVPALVSSGALRLYDVPGLLQLAPLIEEVPGIPGATPLRAATATLGLATSVVGRLRRSFRG